MTGPPEHRNGPQKVTIRRRKTLPQDTIKRHLQDQNNPVVHSNAIIMVMKLPVAEEDHPLLRANPIAAVAALMTGQKEVMAVNHRARKENTNQEKTQDIRTTAQRAVSAVARRKVLNQEILHIRGVRPMMISPNVALMGIHPGKKGPM